MCGALSATVVYIAVENMTVYSFTLIKETHKCNNCAKWEVVSPVNCKALLRGIFQSSSALTAGQVKNCFIVHDLYTH